MTLDCESCGKRFTGHSAPCPDGIEGCLVFHTDKSTYICPHCGHDNSKYVAQAILKGPHHTEIGMGVGNIDSIKKLELYRGKDE